jgi:N-formylglutamate deformylase
MTSPTERPEARRMANQGPRVVIHVPHASTIIPEELRPMLSLTDDELRHEILLMTDRYTDELFRLRENLAKAVVFPVSRLVVDPERFADDEAEPMAVKGMGAIYTRTSGGKSLRACMSPDERRSLLDAYYVPHQQAVASAIADALAAHGTCLLVDAHSFPSKPLPHESDQTPNRCQICIGTDDYHTPAGLVDGIRQAFEQIGLSVGVNRPFSGTFVPTDFYRSDRNVVSVMIEINRRLYMDEATGERLPGFDAFQAGLRKVLMELAARFRPTDEY